MDIEIYKSFTDRVKLDNIDASLDLPFKSNLAAYQQWETGLPLNADTAASSLASASQALLNTQVPIKEKFTILNEAQGCLNSLLARCKEALSGANLPLRRQQAELSSKLLNILASFSQAYIQVISLTDHLQADDIQQGSDKPTQAPVQTDEVIFKTMELLAKEQLLKSLVYQYPEANFWNMVNALYSLAEALNIHQKEQLTFDKGRTTSIEAEFKKIHFFNLAGINRFRRGDIKKIHEILTLHAGDITISTIPGDAPILSIDLASCSAVAYTTSTPDNNDTTRYLDTEQLVMFMLSDEAIAQEQHGAISLIADKPQLTKNVIDRLIPNWATHLSRQSDRYTQSEDILIYPGFDSIIKALVLITRPDAYKKKTTTTKAVPEPFSLSDVTLVPIDNNHHSHVIHNDSIINTMLKRTAENSASSNSIWAKKQSKKPGEKGSELSAEINDTSLHGLQFTVTADNKPLLRVTDLIGIQTKTEALQLAVIRRINRLENGDISVGAEMMTPNLKIASLQPFDKESETQPIIFLQGIPSINQADAIISPRLIENKNVDVILKVNKQISQFSIAETVETNRIFSHYTVLKKTEVD